MIAITIERERMAMWRSRPDKEYPLADRHRTTFTGDEAIQ